MRIVCNTLLAGCLATLPTATALAQQVREVTPREVRGLTSQGTRTLTLEEAVRLGLEHSAGLRAALANTAEAEAGYREARAQRLPSISSQLRYTRLSDNIRAQEFAIPGVDTSFAFLPMELDHYHLELSVEQPIFTGSRLSSQVRAAEHRVEAAEWVAERERAAVAFEVRRAYWTLYEAIMVRDALDTALLQVEEHLHDVRSRLDAGTALTSDRLSAEARLAEVRLERLAADNAVRVARLQLNRLIGVPLGTTVQPIGEPQVERSTQELERLVSQALEASPRLNALHGETQGLEAELSAAEAAWFPDVSLFGRYIHARPNPYFLAEQDRLRGTWEVGASLSWNIWHGGQRAARTGQARARLEAAEARLEQAREQAVVDVSRWYLEVEHTAEAVDVAAQNIRAAEEALRVARQQYAEGVALSEQVLTAEQAYRTAQTQRARSLADHAVARAGLLEALGKIW